MRPPFRQTKIIATLGPASSTPERLTELLDAGVDVFRVNGSHGAWESHQARIEMIRRVARHGHYEPAVLLDLPGPKLRVELAEASLDLPTDSEVDFLETTPPVGARAFSCSERSVSGRLKVGDRLLLDDGALELCVERRIAGGVRCRVAHGGVLLPRKGLSAPGALADLRALTDGDRALALQAVAAGVDAFAMSFVGCARDLDDLRALLSDAGATTPIYAKIERPTALDHLDEIIAHADGILVARGDLGVELPLERVPAIQKDLIERSHLAGKPVITATQMLESMIEHARPTRAEVSDVANAIYDGSDAVMLSGETAVGKFPVDAVRVMNAVARQSEPHVGRFARRFEFALDNHRHDFADAICFGATQMCRDLEVALIVVSTFAGDTALRLSKNRPGVPILAVTERLATVRECAFYAGVHAVHAPEVRGFSDLIDFADRYGVEHHFCRSGDSVVFVHGEPFGEHSATEVIHLRQIR